MNPKGPRLVATAAVAIEDFPVAVAWTPDGSALTVGGGEGRLYLLRADGSPAHQFGEHAPGVLQLAWQPKGTWLASSGQDGSVQVWSALDADPATRTLHRAARWPAGLAWRGDGKVQGTGLRAGQGRTAVRSAGRIRRKTCRP
ncbi:MAG: hypothetical protein WDO12_08615 [Pseudomonadota bacterium]